MPLMWYFERSGEVAMEYDLRHIPSVPRKRKSRCEAGAEQALGKPEGRSLLPDAIRVSESWRGG